MENRFFFLLVTVCIFYEWPPFVFFVNGNRLYFVNGSHLYFMNR